MSTERDALLAFYDAHKRDLPWRRTRDPYAIWVSEIMLQQTRVETVVPYYQRFLARFPDPSALASAAEDEVLAAWSGLGYYRRARLLHAGVREVVARYGGKVPEERAARLALPGIGKYTAGAIGSIAFEREEPIVDGNVARVVTRLRGIEGELGSSSTEKQLWLEAEALVRGPRPGDLNQALMELGATVCTPRSPSCSECPLAPGCVARREDRTGSLPVPRPKKAPKRVALVAVLIQRPDGSVYLERGDRALFGGLYGLPMAESDAGEMLRARGIDAEIAEETLRIEHVLTHRVLEVTIVRARAAGGTEGRFFDVPSLDEVGIATLTRRILEAAGITEGRLPRSRRASAPRRA